MLKPRCCGNITLTFRPLQANDKPAAALRALNAKLHADPRVTPVIVPIGDGMTLCRKR